MNVSQNHLIEPLMEVGNKLMHPPSSIPELIDLLDELERLLVNVKQQPSKSLQEALLLPMKALVADELFRHTEPDVNVTVASCLNQIMRISAPVPPYDDDKMKEVFKLIVSAFENLSCPPGRCFTKVVSILNSIAKLRSCVMMLDLDCDPLITKMFELFQRKISSKHPHSVFHAMEKIMSVMIQESDPLSLELLKVLLASITRDNQDVSPASWQLCAKVIENCADKLKPYILEAVTSIGGGLEDYAPIVASICQTKPDEVITEASAQLNHSVKYVQGLEAIGHSQSGTTNSVGVGNKSGNASKRPRKPDSLNPDERNGKQINRGKASLGSPHGQLKGSSVASRSEDKERPQKNVASKRVRESASFEHKQPSDGDCIIKGRPEKKVVSGVSGSPGNHFVKQQKDFGGSSGNKSKKSQPRKDKSQADDASRKQRKRSSSDDDVIETPHGRKKYKDDLVGCRIKVWWPLDRRYYEGTVSSFNEATKKHKVDYDDGDEEILNLRKECWEFVGDESPIDIVLLTGKQISQPSSDMQRQEASNEGEKETSQMHTEEKELIPDSEVECGVGSHQAIETVEQSEIPATLSETKRPMLTDGENS